MVHQPLPRAFFARPVLRVARDCIGKHLVYDSPDGLCVGRIVEAEAYRGPEDRAAHSFGGRRTARTEVMFGPPGHAYVFFVYGMHFHLNLVTTAVDMPHAVLLRAVEPIVGAELMAERRGTGVPRLLAAGPGRLCEALGITREHDGAPLDRPPLELRAGSEVPIERGPRIGITKAADRPWRYAESGSKFLSRPIRSRPRPRS